MAQSESIGKLSMALTGLQSKLRPVLKTEDGELSRYKYADLAQCVALAQPLLAEFELSVMHTPGFVHDPIDGLVDTLETQLSHSSGEWKNGTQLLYLTKKAKGGGVYESLDAQTQGSQITYARRYGFCAILGIVQEDDDGQAATTQQRRRVVEGPEEDDAPIAARTTAPAESKTTSSPVPKEEWTALMEAAQKLDWPPEYVKLCIETEDKRGRQKDERSLFNWAKAKFSKQNERAETK